MSMYQSYDRNKLVRQVQELLESEGLQPVAQNDPKPEHAAMLLLRSFGWSLSWTMWKPSRAR
ncbi:hypothetical protein HFP72_05935 [Nocardiopsis sp. ARC36]